MKHALSAIALIALLASPLPGMAQTEPAQTRPAQADAQTTEELSWAVVDLLMRQNVERQLEQTYWEATEDWILGKNGDLTEEQLAQLRAAGKAEVPGAFDYVIPPAREAIAALMTEEEMKAFLDTYTPETRDAFKETPLGRKLAHDVFPALTAAMQGPASDLMSKRLGNYRIAVFDNAVARSYVAPN